MATASLHRIGILVAAFGFCLGLLQTGAAQAQSWPTVSEDTLRKYLFTKDGEGHQRLNRWESDMVLDFYFSSGKRYMKKLVKEFNDRNLMGDRQVHLLPPANSSGGGQLDKFNFALGVREDFYSLALESEQKEHGQGEYATHARRTGCFARPVVRGAGGQGVITAGKIMARKDLKKDELRDCLLRGMLLSAGLEHTQDLAYDEQPMSEEERQEAFDVLQLLYHPSVRTGMTHEEFTQTLRAEGLIKG